MSRDRDMEKKIFKLLADHPALGHKALAKMSGISRTNIWCFARKHGIKQSTRAFGATDPEKEARIVDALRRGAKHREICADQDCSRALVYRVARKNGLMRRRPYAKRNA
jgi:hypothetical protein